MKDFNSSMNIELTEWQTETLQPFFKAARKAFNAGTPAGVFAQVWSAEGLSFLEVRLVDHESCRKLQEITGASKDCPDGKSHPVIILTPDTEAQ